MTYTVYDSTGKPLSGDSMVSLNMQQYADANSGYIKDDDTGLTVYPEEASS